MGRNIFSELYHKVLKRVYLNFDGVIVDNIIGEIPDLVTYFSEIRSQIDSKTNILISYCHPFFNPKKITIEQNWLDKNDLSNILYLAGFSVIKTRKLAFGLVSITIAKPLSEVSETKKHSVSIIIPARNEEGNIKNILPSIPNFGKSQEIIFVEGGSTDKTWSEITKLNHVTALKQNGHGKKDAVILGLSKATGDILMIYDADQTVNASDLPKFYKALVTKKGRFANGSRMIYPMEKQAMKMLNKIGNRFFSIVFTWILGQRFKDTLCGTKVFWRKDFRKFKFTNTDPFGDFDLIFSAVRNNLKVVEIPVRYKERVYGSTNINRFKHGLLLIKMSMWALLEFKLLPRQNTQ